MNYHYPKTRRQWQEKIERRRLMKNLLPDDRQRFDQLSKNIYNSVNIINNNGFDLDKILSNKIKEIKFDFLILDTNDQSEKLPFEFIIEGWKSRLQWTTYDYENYLYRNEEFINLIEKYTRMYYAIKILDNNMDDLKLKIKQLYPEFHRIDCDYRYNTEDDSDSKSDDDFNK